MGGRYESDGYEIRSCDLALYFYRRAQRPGRRRLGTERQGSMVAPASAPPLCRWCLIALDALDVACDGLCRRCAADRDRGREVV